MTRSQDAIRRLFNVTRDDTGNMPSFPSIFPDSEAPIITGAPGDERMLTMMRWGFPPPDGNRLSTNIRHLSNPFWRPWLKPQYRCLVPVSSFSEYAPKPTPETGKKDIVWFALDSSRPLFAFAGMWRPWSGRRGTKDKPVEGDRLLYSFLTCNPNAAVEPIHSKAMPVILREDDWDTWLTAEPRKALKLQQPWPDDELYIVARGQRATKRRKRIDGRNRTQVHRSRSTIPAVA